MKKLQAEAAFEDTFGSQVELLNVYWIWHLLYQDAVARDVLYK